MFQLHLEECQLEGHGPLHTGTNPTTAFEAGTRRMFFSREFRDARATVWLHMALQRCGALLRGRPRQDVGGRLTGHGSSFPSMIAVFEFAFEAS